MEGPVYSSLIFSRPAIGEDGTIYVSSYNGKLYAINPDGSLKWVYAFTKHVEVLPLSPPVIDTHDFWLRSETIYIASGSSGDPNTLWALNADGTLKWSHVTNDYSGSMSIVVSPPVIGKDGIIYVSFTGNKLYAIKPDGTLKWTYATLEYSNSPALGSDGSIYISSWSAEQQVDMRRWRIDALNPDGTTKWIYSPSEPVAIEAPAVGAGVTIYVGGAVMGTENEDLGKLYAINSDGTLRWSLETDSAIITAPVIASNGNMYVGSHKNLYSFSPNGQLLWNFTTNECFSSPAIGEDGTLYAGSFDGKLYAINANGNVKWSYGIGEEIPFKAVRSPAIGIDGTIYVAAGSKLYAIGK